MPGVTRAFQAAGEWTRQAATPLREGDGTLAGVVLIVRDVTQSKLMEHELERCLRRLVSAGAPV